MSNDNAEYLKFNKHFPKTISQEIKKYVIDDVLISSRYIFIRRVARVQFGYCTHCQKRYQTPEPFNHNDIVICPKCSSKCKVKNHGTSRKYLYDSGFVVYYEKSRTNPKNAIIVQAFKVSRDYRGDYTQVSTKYTLLAKYLFVAGNPGQATMYENYYWRDEWYKNNSVYSLESKSSYSNNRCCIDSIRKAIAGTPFQYSTWEEHLQPQCDYVKFFALYSNYPAVEYLTKLGFGYFVRAKLFDRKTYSCINWRGNRIDQILRLSSQDIKEVMSYGERVNPMHLRLFQRSRGDSNRPTIQTIISFFNTGEDLSNELKTIMKYANIGQIMNYIQKQINRPENETYRDLRTVLIDWKDYVQECKELEYDLNNCFYLFPKDLHEAHQRTMKLIQMRADEILDQKIQKRIKELNRFCFEYEGLMIRPAKSAQELIREGKKLQHCVGRYAEDHAKGKTSIFFIRRDTEPNKPFYTLELRGNNISQTRGFKNCRMTEEVEKFVDKFNKACIQSKPSQRTVRKGVAI